MSLSREFLTPPGTGPDTFAEVPECFDMEDGTATLTQAIAIFLEIVEGWGIPIETGDPDRPTIAYEKLSEACDRAIKRANERGRSPSH